MPGRHTLVLNSDYTPMCALPPMALDWKDSIVKVMQHQLKALHYYENWEIRSPKLTVLVPSVVVRTEGYISIKRGISDTKYENAFIRDEYVCQYCGAKTVNPTADHVHPRSAGGSSKLTNISTACASCNNKKGSSKTMKPKTAPYMPTYYELVRKSRSYPIYVPHQSWSKYIGWEESLIRIVEPTGMPGYTTIFS